MTRWSHFTADKARCQGGLHPYLAKAASVVDFRGLRDLESLITAHLNRQISRTGRLMGNHRARVRFKIGAGIVKPAGLRIRLRSGAPQGGFVIRPAKK